VLHQSATIVNTAKTVEPIEMLLGCGLSWAQRTSFCMQRRNFEGRKGAAYSKV